MKGPPPRGDMALKAVLRKDKLARFPPGDVGMVIVPEHDEIVIDTPPNPNIDG